MESLNSKGSTAGFPAGFIAGRAAESAINCPSQKMPNPIKSILRTPGKKGRVGVSFSPATQNIVFEEPSPASRILTPIREVLSGFIGRSEPKRDYSDILRKKYSYSYSLVGHYKSNRFGFWFILCSIGLVATSATFFFVAFFTNFWGVIEGTMNVPTIGNDSDASYLMMERKFRWKFGLWMCCRNDGICLSLRWPTFYSVARLFSVFSLFGHIFTLAWLVGHTLEKLLKYDLCTMLSLITLAAFTCVTTLVAVLVFAFHWENYFSSTFTNISSINKSFSFYLAVAATPLMLLSSIALVVDLQSEWRLQEIRRKFSSGSPLVDGDV